MTFGIWILLQIKCLTSSIEACYIEGERKVKGMHTKGKVIVKEWEEEIIIDSEYNGFGTQFKLSIWNAYQEALSKVCTALAFTRKEARANADRIASLWNAADDMTTDDAVRYLEHGREMVELLGRAIKTTNAKYLREDIENLLAKLEGK
jgi:hypothetical protein